MCSVDLHALRATYSWYILVKFNRRRIEDNFYRITIVIALSIYHQLLDRVDSGNVWREEEMGDLSPQELRS